MRTMPDRWRLATTVIALVLLVGGSGLPPAAGAQTTDAPPSLALPDDAALAGDRALVVADAPVPLDGPADLTTLVAEAIATVGSLPAAEWEVEALAATFGGDAEAAFRMVRDTIAFEPYPGVLRGAEGTLAARAGNAFDRALLLKALLDGMGVTSRFAFGHLSEEVAAGLVERTLEAPARPLPDGRTAAATGVDLAAVAARARRDHALIRAALDTADATLGGDPVDDPVAETRSHAWVQVAQDGGWVDLDPSAPDAAMGARLTDPSEVSDGMPEGHVQSVTVRLEVETLTDGVLGRTTALEVSRPAASLAGSHVFLYFQPETGGGGLLFGGGSTEGSFQPLLMIDGEVTAGEAFSVLDQAGDGGFGLGGGGGSVALAGLWLTMVATAPGVEPLVTTTPLLDRMPDAARASGTVTPEELAPLPSTDAGPLAMGTIRHLMVSTSGQSPRAVSVERADSVWWAGTELTDPEAAAEYALGDLLWPVAVADDTITLVTERVLVPAIGDPGRVVPVIARPRLVVTAFGADASGPDLLQLDIDIVADAIRLVARPDADPVDLARRRLWYGTLGSALETEVMRQTLSLPDAATAGLESTSVAMSEPLTVLTSADAGSSAILPTALRAALGSGRVAVVPGDPGSATAWWTIDPSDGATRAVLAPDGGASRGTRVGPFNSGGGTRMVPPSQQKVWDLDPPRKRRLPPARRGRADCRGGNEYIAIVGCVSAPTALIVGSLATAIATISAFKVISAIRG